MVKFFENGEICQFWKNYLYLFRSVDDLSSFDVCVAFQFFVDLCAPEIIILNNKNFSTTDVNANF